MVLDHFLPCPSFEPLHGAGLANLKLSLQAWTPTHRGEGGGQ
jgi:hypothetical protein